MVGKTILHYKIIEKLGEGGMGIVYKAEDTKLNRNVAIKILPSHLLVSEDDKTRFQREAKAAAALNHSNIATVYEINEFEENPFIVMEYVPGKTLNVVIDSETLLPIKEAINIAAQVAEGLKAAHSKGIVHRDIKPSNILVSEEAQAKILDFGLAKTSMSTKLTQMGTTIGTVAYMSPEQVKGEEVDHRTDLWSIGVVLYQMICGRLPFAADYDQAIFYGIQNEEPAPLTAIRSDVAMSLEWIVGKLMAKDPKERYQSANDLIIDLKAVDLNTTGMSRISRETVIKPDNHDRLKNEKSKTKLPWSVAAFTSIIALILILFILNYNQQQESQYLNLNAVNNESQQIVRTDMQMLAISPDGQTVVYCMNDAGTTRLYLRQLNSFNITPLEGTENASSPFFSPNGQWIGFNAGGKLKKVSLQGKSVEIIHDTSALRGATWGPDNKIIFSPSYVSGLFSIDAGGGKPEIVSVLDSVKGERTHRWPQITPDGKHVIYTIGDINNPNSYENAQIAIQSLEDGSKHILSTRGEMARYVEPGYLFISKKGVLLAAPFDMKNYSFLNSPIAVQNDIDGDDGSGIAYFDVSDNGNLVYIAGNRNQNLEMVWVDLNGVIKPIPIKNKPFVTPRISPDGKKTAITLGTGTGATEDIWLIDNNTSVFSRFTFGNGSQSPVWDKNSNGIYYAFAEAGFVEIKYKSLHGGVERPILERNKAGAQYPVSVSPDSKYLVLNNQGGVSEGDIIVFDMEKQEIIAKEASSDFYSYGGYISPNGKYLTYGSNETGRLEIYVKSFPEMNTKWQLSTDGGFAPQWSPAGDKVYFINNFGKMISVPIKYKPFFTPGKPQVAFDVSQMYFPNNPLNNYDITSDGKRFIMIRNKNFQNKVVSFSLITNWFSTLEDKFDEK